MRIPDLTAATDNSQARIPVETGIVPALGIEVAVLVINVEAAANETWRSKVLPHAQHPRILVFRIFALAPQLAV
jgi:hypothetical protein